VLKISREQAKLALDLNRVGEGPSAKAITQAEEYADKLEKHDKEKQLERERQEETLREELEECVLEEELAPNRAGVACTGFGHLHPTERTRRRLFAKVLLRRSRALELLGETEAALKELHSVLCVEPDNPEAKQQLSVFKATMKAAAALTTDSGTDLPTGTGPVTAADSAPTGTDLSDSVVVPSASSTATAAAASRGAQAGKQQQLQERQGASAVPSSLLDSLDDDDEEDTDSRDDKGSTAALLESAAEYLRRSDYASALQIYNYARNCCKQWESPAVELKVLSNTSLCLQRLRGRLPELVSACNEAIARIAELRQEGGGGVPEEMLLRMECACLSRRGSAYAQQQRPEESDNDAARVRELLACVSALEAKAVC